MPYPHPPSTWSTLRTGARTPHPARSPAAGPPDPSHEGTDGRGGTEGEDTMDEDKKEDETEKKRKEWKMQAVKMIIQVKLKISEEVRGCIMLVIFWVYSG